MMLLVGRVKWAISIAVPSLGSAGRRIDRAFRPQPLAGLERRALPSSSAATSPVSPPAGTSVAGDVTPNVPYPTTGGRSQLLDVYVPTRPAPTGGYPVMIAIHGGAWRKRDKGP